MSRIADTYARISPKLAHKPGSTAASRLHARLHFVAMYPGYDHYRSIATRTMPVFVLEPR